MRILFWLGSTAMAIMTYDSLQYVTALIGVNSLLISVLLPIVFYMIIHRHTLGTCAALGYGAVLVLASVLAIVISVVDVDEFIDSLTDADGTARL